MGQIQNAISGAVGSVAVGAIAEQKTKGMKKEIEALTKEKETLTKDVAGLTEQKKKQEKELYARDLEMEYIGASIEEDQQEKFKLEEKLKDVQARFSEVKSQLAEINLKKEQEAIIKGKERRQKRIAEKKKSSFRGRR